MTNLIALPNGTELVSDYRIERVLGAGGFGITYLAEEIALHRAVTIKEYFPSDFAARAHDKTAAPRSQDCAGDYRWGLDRFIEEAQTLAKFSHPNIVRVYRYFRANNTGYMVLHFEEGQSLKSWLKGLGRAPRQKELDVFIAPLLDALEIIHKADFLHRDIAPDNIIIRKTGDPVLIDFGSARGEIAMHSKTVSALVKPGYSPYEQYAERSSQQGPWTDIYALGATLYHAVTGKRPPDAPSRMVKDEIVPAREAAISSYRPRFLNAIDRALALNVDARPQSIAAWRGDLLAPDEPKPGWLARGAAKKPPASEPAPPAAPAPSVAASPVPPPPDAPGPQGGLLDFFEGLKRSKPAPAAPSNGVKAAPAAASPTPGAADAAQPQPQLAATVILDTPPPPPKVFQKARKEKENAKAAAKKPEGKREIPPAPPVAAQPPAPTPKRQPRPRPIRSGEGRSWRPLLFKLLIGAGVATTAVAVQDKLPAFRTTGSAVQTAERSNQPTPLSEARGHAGGVTAVGYTDDGRSMVTTGADGKLKIWSTTGTLSRTLDLGSAPATSLALRANRALTGHADGQIQMWDLEKAERIASFRRNEANVWSVTFTGEADRFAASGHDWKIALWDARKAAAPVHVLEGHDSAAQAVAYAPKGSLLASGSADKTVKLWNLDTLDLMRTYRGHRDFVTALAFAPDGKTLAAAGLDGVIRLWSTASNRLIRTLRGHKDRVGGLAFAPGGEALASASEDGTLRLWDLKSGKTIRTLTGHGGGVQAVGFSPDGSRLASAGSDGVVRLWAVDLPKTARVSRD